MTFGLQQLFQISLKCRLCLNHRIEGFLHCGRQIICIDVLPLQFFLCHRCSPSALAVGFCRLFVPFGFPDDWRLIVPFLVLFVFFVIVVVRISRWGRVGCDGENLVDASCPLLLQPSMKLYRISGHVAFLLTFVFEGCATECERPIHLSQFSVLAALPKRFFNDHESSGLSGLGAILLDLRLDRRDYRAGANLCSAHSSALIGRIEIPQCSDLVPPVFAYFWPSEWPAEFYFCISSWSTSAARCRGMGVANASYWSFKQHAEVAVRRC